MRKMKMFFPIVIFGIVFFCFLLNAQALMYGYITGGDVRLRASSNTSSTVLKYLDVGDVVTLENTSLISGTGCSEGWYRVKSGSSEGYICSKYVSLTSTYVASYQRPWTSPKKAILGGAEFISEGYISAGQFTSYLKKFNVNPNSKYSVNNHQYMANLSAPCSEAYNTYRSYRDNGLLTLPLHFTIPIFNNMPETTKHPTDSSPKTNNTAATDAAFESLLSKEEFPESYKGWLRDLHKLHPNWTFSSLKTNLDFNSTALIQQAVGSIEKSSCPSCVDKRNQRTEGNWYIANIETVEYFLDPRNFLDEDSILMFEDLSYNEHQTEAVVKSVLAGTFMSGTDSIDHLSYSSIFMEAGKTYNVSPVYLAALSKQEVGANGGTATSGNRFTYEGITYEGFYNFYNIGANSSASNPVLKGLVYASAGAGVNSEGVYVGNITQSSTPNPKEENQGAVQVATQLSQMGLNEKDKVITNITLGSTPSTLKSKLSGSSVSFYKENGSPLGDTEKITTGTKIVFASGASYSAVIYGDLNGDGNINSADLLKMRQYLLGQIKLQDAYFESAKVANLSTVNSADLLRLRQYLLGIKNINQA